MIFGDLLLSFNVICLIIFVDWCIIYFFVIVDFVKVILLMLWWFIIVVFVLGLKFGIKFIILFGNLVFLKSFVVYSKDKGVCFVGFNMIV